MLEQSIVNWYQSGIYTNLTTDNLTALLSFDEFLHGITALQNVFPYETSKSIVSVSKMNKRNLHQWSKNKV